MELPTVDPDRTPGPSGGVPAVIGRAGRSLAREEVIRSLREARQPHGSGTVGEALADLTACGVLVSPRDKRGYRMPDRPYGRGPRACSDRWW